MVCTSGGCIINCKCNTSQLLVHTMGCWCCQKRIGTKLNTKTIPACTCHWPHHFPGSPISLNKIHVNHQIIDINDNFLLTFCVQEILGQRFSVIFHISTSCQSSNKIFWKISKKTQDSVITIVFASNSCLDHIFRHFFVNEANNSVGTCGMNLSTRCCWRSERQGRGEVPAMMISTLIKI